MRGGRLCVKDKKPPTIRQIDKKNRYEISKLIIKVPAMPAFVILRQPPDAGPSAFSGRFSAFRSRMQISN